MIKPDWDDSNWREEYKEMKLLSKLQLELLNNGPRSLSNLGYLVRCIVIGEGRRVMFTQNLPIVHHHSKNSLKKLKESNNG